MMLRSAEADPHVIQPSPRPKPDATVNTAEAAPPNPAPKRAAGPWSNFLYRPRRNEAEAQGGVEDIPSKQQPLPTTAVRASSTEQPTSRLCSVDESVASMTVASRSTPYPSMGFVPLQDPLSLALSSIRGPPAEAEAQGVRCLPNRSWAADDSELPTADESAFRCPPVPLTAAPADRIPSTVRSNTVSKLTMPPPSATRARRLWTLAGVGAAEVCPR
jgi:hypothetical protein